MAASSEVLAAETRAQNEDWTIVLPRRGKQRRNLPRISSQGEQQNPWFPAEIESDPHRVSKLLQKIQLCIKKMESSEFYQTLVDQIETPKVLNCLYNVLGSESKMQMVMYGIGSLESYEPPRLQLSLAILMKRKFSWIGDIEDENPQLPPLPSAAHVVGVGGPGGSGSIRPGSMADRARLAKVPQPEAPLKCPRCDSANTKFCYFNNYSLSQPRHFCKTCRRYWTRGGALRNVPVGGGCRRNNKKSKSSSSTSKSTSDNNLEKPQMGSSNSTSTLIPSEIMSHLQQQTPQMPLMASLHNLSQYNMGGNIGLNFGVGSSHSADMGFQIGVNSCMSAGGVVQQFPFFEHAPNTGLYSFQSDQGVEASSSLAFGGHDHNQLGSMASNSRVSEQQAPVKMEDHQAGLNLSRPFMDWSGNNWTDLSGLNNSSSTNQFL